MKRIELHGKYGEGKFSLVDDDIFELVKQYTWSCDKYGYARRTGYIKPGVRPIIMLHHLILPRRDGLIVDHINRDRLDNRRENLRLVTHKENRANSASGVRSSSEFPYLQAYQRKVVGGTGWCGYVVLSYSNGKTVRQYLSVVPTYEELEMKFKEATL